MLCKEFGWSYDELMNTPYETTYAYTVIMGLERKEIERIDEKIKNEVKKK